jgi:D-amino-acid oxidase
LRLKQAGFKVTVVAKHLPGDLDIDYASPWAGAHFRPIPVTNEAEAQERTLSRETYDFFQQTAQQHPDCGIRFCPGFEYFERPAHTYTDLKPEQQYCTWPGFRVLQRDELPLAAQWGVTYDAWVIDSPRYLAWLQAQLGQDTAIIRSGELQGPEEAVRFVREQSTADGSGLVAVINASGTGLSDSTSFISRGQFLHISNPYHSTVTYHYADGSSTVVVPRFGDGGTLIGGSKEPHDYNELADNKTTAWIQDQAVSVCPDLLGRTSSLEVRRVNVGRRPMRQGGLRIELEKLRSINSMATENSTDHMESLSVIHCYGAGGSGYKVSWGAAGAILSLVQALVE